VRLGGRWFLDGWGVHDLLLATEDFAGFLTELAVLAAAVVAENISCGIVVTEVSGQVPQYVSDVRPPRN
jgi:hypothetical protein